MKASTFLALLCLGATQLAATTYYVSSSSGSDSNSGLTSSSPWKSVAKVNATNFNAGDSILFFRSDEWHESLQASSSGSAGNPVTYDSYGTAGANPKFWGSNVLTNANFTSLGNGIYQYDLGTAVFAVLVNHTFLFDQTASSLTGNGQWKPATGTAFQIQSATDPRTDGNVYTVNLRDNAVFSNYKSYLAFRHLDTDETGRRDIGDGHEGYGFRVQNSTGVTINDSNAYRAGKHHFGAINSTSFVGTNLHAEYTLPGLRYGNASAFVSYGDSSGPNIQNQTSVWNNVSCTHMEDTQNQGVFYNAIVTHGANLGSVTVDGLTTDGAVVEMNNRDNSATVLSLKNVTISNYTATYYPALALYGTGITADRIKIFGSSATAELGGNNMILQNAVIAGTNLGTAWYQTPLLNSGTNNTVRFSTLSPIAGSSIVMLTASQGLKVYGNILNAPGFAILQWDGQMSSSSISMSDYNLLPSNPTFGDNRNPSQGFTSINYSSWQSLGFDVHSTTASNPQFANPGSGDYSLLATSPAVNAAALSSSLVGSVSVDLAGNPRLVDSAYDMGAYEYPVAVGTGSHSFPGSINAVNVNTGGSGVGYSNATFSSTTVGLGQAASWVRYQVNFAATSKYYLTARVATGAANESIQFQVDGVNVTGDIPIPQQANYDTYTTVSAENVEVSAGSHIIKAYTSSGGINFQSFAFAISLPGTIPGVNVIPGGEGVGYHNVGFGSNSVGFSYAGGWTNYQVHVSTTGKFLVSLSAATGSNNENIKMSIDGVNVTGNLPVINGNDYNSYHDSNAENVEITAGDHIFQVGTDSGGINYQSLTLVSSLPGTIQASNVNLGGEGVGYHGIGISPSQIGFSSAQQWANYTVHVSTSSKYHLSAMTATGASGETIQFQVDGKNVTGDLPVANTGNWSTYAETTADNIELSPGNHVIEAYSTSGGINLKTFTFTQSLPDTIQASNVKMGGEGIGYHGIGINPVAIGLSQAGQWARYDVNVSASGNYYIYGMTGTAATGESIFFKVDSTTITGDLSAPNTGDYNTFAKSAATTVALTAGNHVLEVGSNTGGLNLQSITLITSLPGTVQVANTNLGGEGVGYHDLTIYPAEVGFTNAGDYGLYTVNVATAGTYKVITSTRTGIGGETVNVLVDGVDVTGAMAVTNTNWSSFATTTKTGVSLSSGPHTFKVITATGGFYMNNFSVIP